MGTHNEFYHFSNLFIQDAFGSYFFDNPDDFYAGRIKEYRLGGKCGGHRRYIAGRLHSGPECWDFMCRTISAQRIGST